MSALLCGTKKTVQDLALFGGEPVFRQKLCIGKPNLANQGLFLHRVQEILARNWLTNDGPMVQEFEASIRSMTGAKHCIAVCNATAGLEILLKAMNLTGEVIVPSFTFVATAHAVQWAGLKPVFCEIDPLTHNIDPVAVSELIGQDTAAILGVHVWGRPCDVEALEFLAKGNGIKLLFDAAHAFGCSDRGRSVGRLGDAEVFSFHATKFLNSVEGGAICTDDDELAAKLRRMRNFGFVGVDQVSELGTNAKMNEFCAAMGLTNLECIESLIFRNQTNYSDYQAQLADIPGLQLTSYSPENTPNYQYIVIEVFEQEFGMSRDALAKILWAENILARRYFYPGCHQMQAYAGSVRLPLTESLCERVLTLPNGLAVDAGVIEAVCDLLRFVQAHAGDFASASVQAA